jgi:hypothetical protein
MNTKTLRPPDKLALGCMIVTAVAAFLPWASLFGISVSGVGGGDGFITLICAAIGASLLVLRKGPRWVTRFGPFVLAAIVVLIGLADMTSIAAIGLYLTLFAGIGWVVALVWGLRDNTPIPSVPPAHPQYSPDGQWWWDGHEWVAAPHTPPAP